ncbi:hypothetical protein HO133_007196 [Letharia lupina]|uniref:Mitochondrial thiamine pyrophosphate carrier 1 n=1 Tax=Letharia lupina TaxID=560253 RepID=A0A8H6KYJ0_9LECA|nr:uncharacterized protein HO133_007196 [Letharia lupina]KAF6229082.1 hypothetical protein HO133_007196 [Letharia lupina]
MDGEDQTVQDARVSKLWKTLDTRNEGRLNLNGLKKGLSNINHPLKNADSLLQDVMKAVDTNRDGRIDYSEFRKFVEQTEKELWQLFKSIDRDHNGQLDKGEIRSAFERAGIQLPGTKLDQFFSEVDTNHDGVITFDEWRDFLLFIPANTPNLRAVLSYYSSTVTVNPEGDVHVSDDNVEGLGKIQFPRNLFAALFGLAKPATLQDRSKGASPVHQQIASAQATAKSIPVTFPWDPGDQDAQYEDIYDPDDSAEDQHASREMFLLTDIFPPVGYFVAGGIAGVVSRTATAPLDRLKVYLIAQVGVKDDAINHAKSGAPLKAAKTAGRPLMEATKALWRMGGIRSLFAGNGLNVVKVMPESAIKFGSYEGSKRLLARLEGHDDPKALKPWTQFFAAGLGGLISQFCVYPLDTLKFRVQNETIKGGLHGNALILATARKMWATSGVRSFYRGLPMGLVGMFPYSAIDLTTFEYLKQIISRRKARLKKCDEDDVTLSNFTTASIGAFSGAFGASTVYPLNLLRTRLQSQGTAIHPPTYTGIWDVTVKTVKGEGIRGLFKGITPNLLKVVPAVSITYVVYDNSKAALGLR